MYIALSIFLVKRGTTYLLTNRINPSLRDNSLFVHCVGRFKHSSNTLTRYMQCRLSWQNISITILIFSLNAPFCCVNLDAWFLFFQSLLSLSVHKEQILQQWWWAKELNYCEKDNYKCCCCCNIEWKVRKWRKVKKKWKQKKEKARARIIVLTPFLGLHPGHVFPSVLARSPIVVRESSRLEEVGRGRRVH